jgi:hypothetical protein
MRILPTGFIPPCLPTKAPRPPAAGEWLHEIKHDGFRVIARKAGTRVRLYSRPGNDLTARFPLIVDQAGPSLGERAGARSLFSRFFSSTSNPWPINQRMASEREGLRGSLLRQSSIACLNPDFDSKARSGRAAAGAIAATLRSLPCPPSRLLRADAVSSVIGGRRTLTQPVRPAWPQWSNVRMIEQRT